MIAPLAALIRYHEVQAGIAAGAATARGQVETPRLLQAMSPNLTARYMKTFRRYGKDAVVPMERGICMGCFMRQPTNSPEVDEDIHQCESCGRLLYSPDVAFELAVG